MSFGRASQQWRGRPRHPFAALAVMAFAVLAGPMTGTVHAAGVGGIIISEVAPWASGSSSYAADWFEVTNTGAVAINLTGWKMDDNSNSFAAAVPMSGVTTIGPGESAIFLESATPATTIPAFTSAWFGGSPPSGLQIGTYSGSGVGLSNTADAVNLYNSTGALQANVSFGAAPGTAPFATFDNAAGSNNTLISTLSVAGTNGAFLVPTPAAQAAIGSPGTIIGGGAPLPAQGRSVVPVLVGVAMLGGFAAINRRRGAARI